MPTRPSCAVVLTVLLLVVITTTPVRGQWQDTYVKMSLAQAKWLIGRPAAYDFTIALRCHCTGIAKTPPTFHVEGMLSTPAAPLTVEERLTYARFDAIEDLFDAIQRALSSVKWTPFKFDVRYDPQLSFPVHADIDPSNTTADDEVGFDVTDFKVVKKS